MTVCRKTRDLNKGVPHTKDLAHKAGEKAEESALWAR